MKKILRKIHNKLYNWWYGVKPIKALGCYNVGVNRHGYIVKMDWGEKFEYLSPKYEIDSNTVKFKRVTKWGGGINKIYEQTNSNMKNTCEHKNSYFGWSHTDYLGYCPDCKQEITEDDMPVLNPCDKCGERMSQEQVLVNKTTRPNEDDKFEYMWLCPNGHTKEIS